MEDDPAELENELYYRKFVIYPQREFIVVKTKEKVLALVNNSYLFGRLTVPKHLL